MTTTLNVSPSFDIQESGRVILQKVLANAQCFSFAIPSYLHRCFHAPTLHNLFVMIQIPLYIYAYADDIR